LEVGRVAGEIETSNELVGFVGGKGGVWWYLGFFDGDGDVIGFGVWGLRKWEK